MNAHESVICRYESKYLVPEATARAIRDHLAATCSPDRHAGPDGRYIVNNLYFDTPDLRFYHDTRFKRYDRFKPRVRFYGKAPADFLWLELKHKITNVTWKTRRRIPLEQWSTLFQHREMGGSGHREVNIRSSFEDVVILFGAAPVLHVRYVREPYVSDLEQYCRITFDRRLSCRLAHGSYQLTSPESFVLYDDPVSTVHLDDNSPTLVEIKTETNVPGWVMELIQRFDLQQRGFSKYCNAIECQKGFWPCAHRTLAL